jgi:uncharacterized protein (TIGR02646 family)
MISINKPAAPHKLLEGVALNAANCTSFANNSQVYEAGTLNFEIASNFYGHASVKKVLRSAQHGKCCFCEGKFEANAAADVEHYRPKKYSQQAKGSPKIFPGYYWLAYDWSNLYYSCQVCNRSHKKNFFPLRHPNARVRSHLGNLAQEEPLLVDPGVCDPRDHIRFRSEIAFGMTDDGTETVNVVGLNRAALVEERLAHCNVISTMQNVVAVLGTNLDGDKQALVAEAQAYLDASVLPVSKFSSMALDMLHGAGAV